MEMILIWEGKVSSPFRAGRLQGQDPEDFPLKQVARPSGKAELRRQGAGVRESRGQACLPVSGENSQPGIRNRRRGVGGWGVVMVAESPADIS